MVGGRPHLIGRLRRRRVPTEQGFPFPDPTLQLTSGLRAQTGLADDLLRVELEQIGDGRGIELMGR